MVIKKENSCLSLCAVGDVALCDGVEEKINTLNADFLFAKIKKIIANSDIVFANLENVFTDAEIGLAGQAHILKSHIKNIRVIEGAGFNVVSLANNHIMDYGAQGLSDTITALDSHGIYHVGAGQDLLLSRRPVIIEKNGIRLGILAYAMRGTQSATINKPGAAVVDFGHIADDITLLKPKVDHVVISLHAGLEFIDYPHPDHRAVCHEIAMLSPSLIVGHHPHIINGFETINNCLIAYSLGNFIFDTKIMDYTTIHSSEGLILKCSFSKEALINYSFIPTVINEKLQVEMAENKRKAEIINRLNEISVALQTDSYPKVYFDQASKIWTKINIAVNLQIIKKQGLRAFIKRIPRIKKIYIILTVKYFFRKIKKLFLVWA